MESEKIFFKEGKTFFETKKTFLETEKMFLGTKKMFFDFIGVNFKTKNTFLETKKMFLGTKKTFFSIKNGERGIPGNFSRNIEKNGEVDNYPSIPILQKSIKNNQ